MRSIAALATLAGTIACADVETEDFANGFSTPVFRYQFEFDACCFAIEARPDDPGNDALHLFPNFVNVTFDLAPGEIVESASVEMLDFEGGIAGTPVSVVIFRGESGDFISRNADDLGVATTVCAHMDDIGQFMGVPLGPIVQIDFQASNEEFLIPGAFYDDITVSVVGDCLADFNADGSLDILDFVAFQNAFVRGDLDADCTGDRALDVLDFVCFQNAFVAGCR